MILLLGLLAWLGWWAYRNRSIIAYPQVGPGARASELEDRIDPNKASAAELAALPVIGPKVGREIVEYRERYHADGRPGEAFKNVEDLLKVAVVGANTLEQIKPYLKFPATSTTERIK